MDEILRTLSEEYGCELIALSIGQIIIGTVKTIIKFIKTVRDEKRNKRMHAKYYYVTCSCGSVVRRSN